MAAQRKCEECGAVRRCRLVIDPSIKDAQRPKGLIVYLCLPCKRRLGYADEGGEG